MKELQEILKAYRTHLKDHTRTALATVVHLEGSSYRRPGARMLVAETGELTGAISGGCLEGDALRKARLAMVQGTPSLVKYDTMDEDDSALGVGLGCHGIIHILIEPINPENPDNPLAILERALQKRQDAVIVTIYNLENRKGPQIGTCLYRSNQGSPERSLEHQAIGDEVNSLADKALSTRSTSITTLSKTQDLTALVEFIPPPIALVICGAGNDTKPLIKMAHSLGWETILVDGRPNYATQTRFPEADRVLVAKPDQVLSQVPVDARTAFLLMTHNYHYDLAMLRQLLPLHVPYIGILGPRLKTEKLLLDLETGGLSLTSAQLATLHGPVGLDVGAETAEEIALSVLSEVQAFFARASGGPLKEKPLPIHAQEVSSSSTLTNS